MPYDLPSWLQADAPSEPFKALLAGAQVGNEIAKTVNSARSQAGALAQRAYEFEKVQQVQEGIHKYQLQEAELHLEKMKLAKDYEFQTNRAAIEIGNLVNTTDPNSPDFIQKLYGIGSRYPAVMRDEVYQHAAELPKQASQLRLQAAQAYHQMNPAPANAADTAAIEAHVRGLEMEDIGAGKQPWTPQQRLEVTNKLRQQKEFNQVPKGTTMRFNDQGVLQQVDVDGGAGTPTIATASMVQKNLNVAEKNYQLLDQLDKNLRPSDLGVRGVLGEIADRYAPQLGVPGFDPKRASNREALKVSVQAMVRQISSDTRFSEADRRRAEDAMVSFGAGENKERATQVLGTLKEVIRNRAKVDAETGGMAPPGWAFSDQEIKDAVRAGLMTRDKAIELRLKYYPEIYGAPVGPISNPGFGSQGPLE